MKYFRPSNASSNHEALKNAFNSVTKIKYHFMKNIIPAYKSFSILVIFLFMSGSVWSATKTASVSGNWNATATWGGSAVPTNVDDVIINAGIAVTMSTTGTCRTITDMAGSSTINGASLLTIAGNAGVAITNISGTATISSPVSMPATASVTVAGSLTMSGIISGAATSLTKAGAGVLTLSGNNTYIGSTTISAGTISVSNLNDASGNKNLGNGGIIFANGGTLLTNGSTGWSTAKSITINSGGGVITMSGNTLQLTGTISGGGGLTTGGSDLLLNRATGTNAIGAITVTSGRLFVFTTGSIGTSSIAVQNGATLDFGVTGGSTLTNTMTFSSGACLANRVGTLTVSNATFPSAGTMIFNNDDQVTTAITVSGNYPTLTGDLTMQIGGSNATVGTVTLSGNISGNYNLIKTLPGTLSFAAGSIILNDLTINGGSLTSTSGTMSLAGDFTNNGVFTHNSGTVTFNGSTQSIAGSSSTSFNKLTISSTTSTTLGINTSVSGILTVNAGSTLALSTFTLGTPSSTVLYCGATAGSSITGTGLFTTGGNVTVNDAATGTGAALISCPVALGATRTFTVADDGTTANDLTVSGIISTAFGITKVGAGTMTLSGVNTYTGITTINAGILSVSTIGNGGVAGNLGAATNVAANLVLGGGTLQYSGASASTNRSYTLTAGTTSFIDITTNTLTLSGAGANTTGALTKTGTGTLLLTGANLYTGLTTVTDGVLQYGIANTLSSGNVALNGGTLSTGATTGYGDVLGTLALTDNSDIVLGSGSHTLSFTASNGVSWTAGKILTITGWVGGYNGTSGTSGKIIAGTTTGGLTVAQLAQIQFYSGSAYFAATILSNGEVVPAGNSIATGTVSTPPFCVSPTSSAAGTVAYTAVGFYSSATFTAKLSDAAGNFTSPVNIGTAVANGLNPTGNVSITIPAGTASGTGYKIRIDCSGPSVTGASGTAFEIVNGANNVTSPSSVAGDAVATLAWTNPASCYDEIMIVAKAGSSVSATPSGDGTAYSASLAYGSGTAFDGGFVVYKGTTSPQTVTNLTNAIQYYFKFFTRKGTSWSIGVETNATPGGVSLASDYFRSKATGVWSSAATWESSHNGTNWFNATLAPSSTANTITIQSPHIVTVSASVSVDQATINSGGQITVNTGQTLTIADGTGTDLSVSGIIVNTGTLTFTGQVVCSATSTIEYNSTSAQSILDIASPGYGNLTLSNNSIKTAAGALDIQGDLTINTTATFAGGTSLTHNIAGDWSNSGTFSYTTSSTINFNGSLAGNINGTTATSFNNLTLNNSAGITLGVNATITGILTFTNGKITTGSNILILGNAATFSGAGAGKYIYGNLRWTVPNAAAPSKTLEIGDAANYTPVLIAFTGTTTGGGTLTAFTVGTEDPNIASSTIEPTIDVNRYWSLVNSGVAGFTNYSVTFNFVAGDVDAGANTAEFIVGKYNSGWIYPTVGTRTATSTQATGITLANAFGTFAIGKPKTAPTISMQPSGQTVCEGTLTDFNANSTGGAPAPSATWQISTGGPFSNLTIASPYSVATSTVSGITTSTLSIDPTPFSFNNYQYRVIFNNASGNAISTGAILTVNQTSVGGTVNGGTTPICFSSGTGALTLSGHTGAVNKWQKNLNGGTWTDIANTSNTYSETPSSPGTWQYRAEVQSGVCSAVYSVERTIVVNPRPSSVMSGTTTICSGQNATVNIALTGNAPWSLTYTDGTTPINVSSISSSPYTFQVSPASSKTYTVTALSDANCTAHAGDITGSAIITVNTGCQVVTLTQPALLEAVISGSATISCGNSATLTVTFTGGTSPYKVTYAGTDHTGSSPITFNVSPTSNTTYNGTNLTITDANNCSSSTTGSALITITTIPAPVATDATSVTTGGFTANWNASSGATGYRLDVSTASDFSSYVSGYNNLDVYLVTTYPVSGLSSGVTYYYQVRAYTATCTSNNSNVKIVSTTAQTIGAPTVTGAPFTVDCSTPASGSISFTHGTFNSGNVFTAQLSDNTGSFTSPTNIGSGGSSPVSISIPANTPSGTNSYKIRVVSSNPVVTGSVSSTFTITNNPCIPIYRSNVSSGNWNVAGTWQVSTDGGSNWSTALSTPTSSDGTISIRNGHTVTITADVTVDQVTIDAGGILNEACLSGYLHISNGSGTDLAVSGTLTSKNDIDNNGTISFASGSLYQHIRSAKSKSPSGFSNIPVATWDANSTCEILSVFSAPSSGLNQSFGHFKWNFSAQSAPINLSGGLTTVNGNLIIANTGSKELQLASTQTSTLNIGGNLLLQAGKLTLSSGTGVTTVNVSGNAEVQSGAILATKNSKISGSGNFTLYSGGNLWIGSVDGVTASGTTGNIQVAGTRSFSTGANYTYNGTVGQVTGSGLPATINALRIENASGVTLSNNITCTGTLTIATGKLTVPSSNNLTVNGSTTLSVAQCLVLKSDATGTASFIDNGTINGTGTARIERYLDPYFVTSDWKYHFLSSPVENQPIQTEFVNLPNTTDDFMSWEEAASTWINTKDGNGDWNIDFESDFIQGKGYLVAYSSEVTRNFTGKPYTSNDGLGISCTYNPGPGTDMNPGWNLIGNPFPSAINWNYITDDANQLLGSGVDKALYYYDNNLADYLYYSNLSGELGSASPYIPAMQGFMIHSHSNSDNILKINNAARTHLGQDTYHKKSAAMTSNILNLKVEGNSYVDYARVCFYDLATLNFDGDFDAYKLFSYNAGVPQMYSVTPDNTKVAINTLPLSQMYGDVAMEFLPGADGTFTFTADGITSFASNVYIKLEDKKTGTIQKLNDNPVYTYTAATTDNAGRFVLHFQDATGINDPVAGSDFSIYSDGSMINVLSLKPVNGKVQVFDMAGREVASASLIPNQSTRIDMQGHSGIYVVSVITSKGISNSKLVIK